MRSTWNPARRNKNIGTKKSGHGKDNKMVIPNRFRDSRAFWEHLNGYEATTRIINDNEINFFVEPTINNYKYHCTIDDIEYLLSFVPEDDIGILDLIVFRQPKSKEQIISPAWGRMDFRMDIGKDFYTAVIIEAIDIEKHFYWEKSLSPSQSIELEKLRQDGHRVTQDKRGYDICCSSDSVRNTQLYRTLYHEIGHWVQWQNTVLIPDGTAEDYYKIPQAEREVFAHRYADILHEKLLNQGVIPFERKPCTLDSKMNVYFT